MGNKVWQKTHFDGNPERPIPPSEPFAMAECLRGWPGVFLPFNHKDTCHSELHLEKSLHACHPAREEGLRTTAPNEPPPGTGSSYQNARWKRGVISPRMAECDWSVPRRQCPSEVIASKQRPITGGAERPLSTAGRRRG